MLDRNDGTGARRHCELAGEVPFLSTQHSPNLDSSTSTIAIVRQNQALGLIIRVAGAIAIRPLAEKNSQITNYIYTFLYVSVFSENN